MKKIIFLLLAVTLLSCNDGNIDVPSFDFSETVNVCNEYIAYRLGNTNSNEALILTLNSSDIPVEAGTSTGLGLSSSRTITYRLFDATVTTSYFCSAIPPTEPTITKNWEATSGTITIETTELLDTYGVPTGSLRHAITFINLILTSGSDTLPFDTFTFGFFDTTPEI
jgi:hypothetical protein